MNDDGEMTAKKLQGKILPPRHALARSMILGLNDVRLAMIVAERMADRLEGKPVQKLRAEVPHTTIFWRAGDRSQGRSKRPSAPRRPAKPAKLREARRGRPRHARGPHRPCV